MRAPTAGRSCSKRRIVDSAGRDLRDTPVTSCARFWANRLRVLLSAAVYVLTQTFQFAAAGTSLLVAQAPRLRHALLTLGVQMTRRRHPTAGQSTRLQPAS
jgi:hypothetical protein